MCGVLISVCGLAKLFQVGSSGKKSSSIDPERPEKAIISVMKNYLVHFESFEPHILYFHVRIVEKGEVHKAIFTRCCQCSYKRIKCGYLAFISVY